MSEKQKNRENFPVLLGFQVCFRLELGGDALLTEQLHVVLELVLIAIRNLIESEVGGAGCRSS